MDPLVYGDEEERHASNDNLEDGPSLFPALLTETSKQPARGRSLPALRFEPVLAPNTPELDADDIEDHRAFGKILNDAHAARCLRRRQRKGGADRVEGEEDGSSVASRDTGLSLSRALDGADVFLTVGRMTSGGANVVAYLNALAAPSDPLWPAWERLCRGASSETYTCLHGDDPSFNGPTVVAFFQNGTCLVFERPILDFFAARASALRPIASAIALDRSRVLDDLRRLPSTHCVFVYDPMDESAYDLMDTWRCAADAWVMDRDTTSLLYSCVVERLDETFAIYKTGSDELAQFLADRSLCPVRGGRMALEDGA